MFPQLPFPLSVVGFLPAASHLPDENGHSHERSYELPEVSILNALGENATSHPSNSADQWRVAVSKIRSSFRQTEFHLYDSPLGWFFVLNFACVDNDESLNSRREFTREWGTNFS